MVEKRNCLWLCAISALLSAPSYAYELKTHAILTGLSFDRSRLNADRELLASLGLPSKLANGVLSKTYFDVNERWQGLTNFDWTTVERGELRLSSQRVGSDARSNIGTLAERNKKSFIHGRFQEFLLEKCRG
jgi:hypothetical protein